MVNKIRSKLFQAFQNRRLHMFGLFLILSFIFLLLTKFSKTYNETVSLRLNYKNLPTDVVIDSEKAKTVDVEVEDIGFKILPYYFMDPVITLDADKDLKKEGNHFLWVTDINDHIFNQFFKFKIDRLAVKPDSVLIPFSVLKTKSVPVIVVSEIKLAPGFDFADSLKAIPDSVKIIGSKEVLENIAQVETKPIKRANVNSDFLEEVEIVTDKDIDYKIEPSTVQVEAVIDKFTEGTLEIPVTIKNLPKNIKINYFPKSIPVSFYVQLSRYNEVVADDFTIECNYNEIKNTGRSFFSPRLIGVSSIVRNARLKQDKVEFILTK